MANKPRAGAVRKSKKGPTKGTGGHGRKALEGKGPTPKAQDRPYHVAAKRKELAERAAAKRGGQRSNTGAIALYRLLGFVEFDGDDVPEELRSGEVLFMERAAGRVQSDIAR